MFKYQRHSTPRWYSYKMKKGSWGFGVSHYPRGTDIKIGRRIWTTSFYWRKRK